MYYQLRYCKSKHWDENVSQQNGKRNYSFHCWENTKEWKYQVPVTAVIYSQLGGGGEECAQTIKKLTNILLVRIHINKHNCRERYTESFYNGNDLETKCFVLDYRENCSWVWPWENITYHVFKSQVIHRGSEKQASWNYRCHPAASLQPFSRFSF